MLNILNLFLFLISPFLALPTVLAGFVNNSRNSRILFMIIIGVISALYIPHIENDKARYYEMYENVQTMNLQEFFIYNALSNLDFVFQFLIYLASINHINIQYVFFGVTFLTIGLLFNVFLKIIDLKKMSFHDTFFLILLCLFSISIEDLFSGVRFMFASAVMLNAYYYATFEKDIKRLTILSILSVLIHFSMLLFVVPVLAVLVLKDNSKKLRYLFLCSILFMLISQEFLIDLFSKFGFAGVLAEKNNAYLVNDDFVTNSIKEAGEAVRIRYFLYSLWIYLAYIYIYFTKKVKSNFRSIFFIACFIMNLFWAFPTVFFRYSVFVKLVLMCLIIWEYEEIKQKRFKYMFLIGFIVIFLTQILLMRYNFTESFFDRNVFFLYEILSSDPIREYHFLK